MTVLDTPSLWDLVDPRLGVIRSCRRLSKSREEPEVPIVYQAHLSHFDYRKADATERLTTGKGRTDDEAARGAIVEALERYCAYEHPPGALLFAAGSTLDAPSIPPDELVLYSGRQYTRPNFPYRRPEPDEELTWVEGRFPDSGERVYVPASLVYMDFGGAGGREFFAPPTSNGLAGGAGLASALAAAFYELVERDAFLNCWLNRLPVPRIESWRSDGHAAGIRRHYARFELETYAFDLTTDVGIPVVMAITIDRSGRGPAAVVGLGCHLDVEVALDKAVMEVAQMRTGAVPRFRREPSRETPQHYSDVRTLEDHAAFAGRLDYLPELSFLLDGTSRTDLRDVESAVDGSAEAQAEICVERLQAVGSTVAYVDLTKPDVELFAIRVVRALATGLQPIHFGDGEARLGGQRLYEVPRTLGYTTRPTDEDGLNPCPHPLA